MRDSDIREHLHSVLGRMHGKDPDTRIIDELGLLQGMSRVDVAVINGHINGYEIKSALDTLERLPHQRDVYCQVLDTVTVITAESHLDRIMEIVPDWWGIWVVRQSRVNHVKLRAVRESSFNPSVDSYSIAQLLWRDEMLEILKTLGLERGMLSRPRRDLQRKLAENVEKDLLKSLVRECLKARTGWRSDAQRT